MKKNEYDGTKKYIVWFTDEYDNNYLLGFYDELKDAEDDADTFLRDYEDEETGEKLSVKGNLNEYPSTFNFCFDRVFSTPQGCVSIRGFILK